MKYVTWGIIVIITIVLWARPDRTLAVSATQSSDPGCKTLFMLDNQNTVAQLYVSNFDTPTTVQLLQSKNIHMNTGEIRLLQLSSGRFGLISSNRVDDHTEVQYATFDPANPVSLVFQTPDDWRAHFPTVTELSDGTLIAAFSFNKDTEEARISGSKSKCFDGYTGSKFYCTQDVRVKIMKSTDKGLTWTQVTTLDNDHITVDRRGSFFFPSLAVGPNDHLYLLVTEQYYDPNPPQPINKRRDTETLWKSTNRGVSWTRVNNVFTAPFPTYHANEGDLVVEPGGRIVVVFSTNYHPGMNQGDQGDYLLITSSTDDGVSWTTPKIVGKFGPNKGEGSIPSLQRMSGNRYGIRFHKFSDPPSTYSYVFSEPNALSQWSQAYSVDPPDTGNPPINPVCIKDKNIGGSPTPTPTPTSSPVANPADLVPTGDTPGDQVNQRDADQLKADFGKTGSPGWITSDINRDARVDIFDYNILVGTFGS